LATGELALAALPIAVAFSGAAEADAQTRPIPSAVIAAKIIVRIFSLLSNLPPSALLAMETLSRWRLKSRHQSA
jgi:hypothetical protein